MQSFLQTVVAEKRGRCSLKQRRSGSVESVQRQTIEVVQSIFADNPELAKEELDFKELFARILEKEDWTDKLASGMGKIRSMIHRRRRDTEVPEELRALIPNMNDVMIAYVEMTSGYKDFIKDVSEAMSLRQGRRRENMFTDDRQGYS